MGILQCCAARQEVQDEIWEEEVSPALRPTFESLQEQEHPILHTAIITKAPPKYHQSVWVEYFENCSLNRYPIEVAFEEGLRKILLKQQQWHKNNF